MELQIGERSYRTGKLNAFKQLHVARRVAPVLMSLGKSLELLLGSVESKKDETQAAPPSEDVSIKDAKAMVAILPLAEALAAMREEDVDYVINSCLAVCEIQQGNGWQRVQAGNGRLMFDFIELPAMMELTMAVIRENLVPFFPTPQAPATKA